jgi:hypothetical protein
MKNSNFDFDSGNLVSITEEMRENSTKYSLNRVDCDLHREENDVIEKVIRVKRITAPNKTEKWKIFEDTKVVYVLEGTKLNSKEREYLKTVDGFNFLLSQYKSGITSFNNLRNELKKKISKP